jgi:hypothetical protein
MVVVSAAIVSKSKTLLARQFVDMPRLKIEALLSAFGKIVDSQRKDCTYVETESVRYVFQPLGQLYLLLVTTKQSNILEDLDTLRLIVKILQDVCGASTHEEKTILDKAFDIIFAIDEVVSFGYRESVTASQVKSYTEMDSHEERLHQMIEKSKENEAKEVAKRKQLELAKARAQQLKEGKVIAEHGVEMPSAYLGRQDSGSEVAAVISSATPKRVENVNLPAYKPQQSQPAVWTPGMSDSVHEVTMKSGAGKKGMSLGAKKKVTTAAPVVEDE